VSKIALALLLSSVALGPAMAATCKGEATAKKLGGAALTSFMTKCERDAHASCDSTADEKKLAGAAKTSFTTKCINDTVGH
jgi:hypothetical protein